MVELTLLRLTGVGIPPYSARGLTQTLTTISLGAAIHRTVNGRLINAAPSQMRKYSSVITCKDQQAPAFGGAWPGLELTVDCVAELAALAGGTESDGTEIAQFEREHVEGSIRVLDGFTFYRPRLVMMVTAFSNGLDEWAAENSWSLTLEEI